MLKPSPSVPEFDPGQVTCFRLARHHLLDAKPADAVTISRNISGIQAQLMSSAHLALWARNHVIRREEIEAALWQKRSLVKTSLMRQTLHLVPADEFPVYITALRDSRVAGAFRIMTRFGITAAEADALTHRIVEILDAGPMTRTALNTAVKQKASPRVRAWMEKVWSIVRLPIAEGLVCYGPGEGNEATLIRVDQWLPGRRPPISAEQARTRLLRGYLRAYGPATLADFSHWSGMPMREVRPLPALLAGELAEIAVQKKTCLLLREDIDALRTAAGKKNSVRLLPGFDPYLLAHREKDHLLEARHYKRVYRNQGWISAVLLVEGSVAGIWSHKLQGGKLRLTIEPFGKLTRESRAAIARQAESLAGFLESTLRLSALS